MPPNLSFEDFLKSSVEFKGFFNKYDNEEEEKELVKSYLAPIPQEFMLSPTGKCFMINPPNLNDITSLSFEMDFWQENIGRIQRDMPSDPEPSEFTPMKPLKFFE